MSSSCRHVILLSADALRADHLSCYGYPRETTPILDSLAEESIRFTNAYSASSHTREAVPALLTGKYPDVAVDSKYHLDSDTIASPLSEEGFATAGFHSNPFVSRAYGFDRGFDLFDDDLHLGQHKLIALAQRAYDKFRNRHYARAEEINSRSLEWIDSLDDGEPFFLWNHYMDTHGPYEPPSEYATLYADQGLSGRDSQLLYQRAITNPESITDEEKELLINLYDAEIRYNDKYMGAFLNELRDRGILDDSLVIMTSDHGDAFGAHGYYGHPRYLHEVLTHVPMLVRPPGGRNAVVETPVSTLDVVRTIKGTIGRDVDFSLLAPTEGDRLIFSQARGEDKHSHVRRYAARTRDGTCFCERDMQSDSISFTRCRERSLRADLEEHVDERVSVENGEATGDDVAVNDEIEDRLRVLGYRE